MSNIKLSGLVFCALALILVFKNLKNEYSLFVRLSITIAVSVATITLLQPIFTFIETITRNLEIYGYIPVLIKSLGIALIVQITSNCCNDAGESTLGERICLFGKLEIIALSLPLISKLLSLISKV